MNIFITSDDPESCAIALDDRRVNKMCLETAQLLCAAVILNGGEAPYRLTHINHPCSVWARTALPNFKWLRLHGLYLCREYTFRFHREHACESVISGLSTPELPDSPLAFTFNCSGFDYLPTVFENYRERMREKWRTDDMPPRWTGTNPPEWM